MRNLSFLKPGDTVNYLGKQGKFLGENYSGSGIKIVIDGKVVVVDPNDLFGMNEKIDFSSQIALYDKEIEENKTIIKENKTLWEAAKKTISFCKEQMALILSDSNVSTIDGITDSELRQEYFALKEQRYNARSAQIHATSTILTAAIDTGSACSSKINCINQQAIYEVLG